MCAKIRFNPSVRRRDLLPKHGVLARMLQIDVSYRRDGAIKRLLLVYMTVHGMQQHEQSSVERQLHLPD